MDCKKTMYDKLGSVVVKALESRHFEAYYFSDKEDAVKKAVELIPEGSSIGWGGSKTMSDIGIYDQLKNGKYTLIDRDTARDFEEKTKLQKQALIADTFIMSANAISQDGVIVNLDAFGNRAAAMVYGPDSVIVIAGMNKVVKTVDDAVSRTRNIAAPMNAQRFDIETPCKKIGNCSNCKSPTSICSYLIITRLCRPASKIKVILVGEDLGM